jgi:D-alanyl-D-alanine carboxypeptidase
MAYSKMIFAACCAVALPLITAFMSHPTTQPPADKTLPTAALQTILDKTVDSKKVFGANFALQYRGETWYGTAGDIQPDQPYFIASTTKLFTTAIVLHLVAHNQLQLDDPIERYLPAEVLNGLHVFKGRDYSRTLTIRHLLAHTSGLPDYFQGKGKNGKSLEDAIVSGQDQSWTFADVLDINRTMQPLFAPGTPGKAHYSDLNFQLLGQIIEKITQKSYATNCHDLIIQPLGLSKTYLYQDTTDTRPKTLYYKNRPLHIPKAMASFGCDGGMVSTSRDMLVFIEAFFAGKLFPQSCIATLQTWNDIFSPMQSGVGIHRFKLPWYFNPTGAVPELIGHSGLSGALAYYSPKKDLYIVGTVNQVAYPDKSFKTAVKLIVKSLK